MGSESYLHYSGLVAMWRSSVKGADLCQVMILCYICQPFQVTTGGKLISVAFQGEFSFHEIVLILCKTFKVINIVVMAWKHHWKQF